MGALEKVEVMFRRYFARLWLASYTVGILLSVGTPEDIVRPLSKVVVGGQKMVTQT